MGIVSLIRTASALLGTFPKFDSPNDPRKLVCKTGGAIEDDEDLQHRDYDYEKLLSGESVPNRFSLSTE